MDYWVYNFDTKLDKITDISLIRLEKLMESIQSSVLYFIFAIIFGVLMEKIFPNDDVKTVKNRSTKSLVGLILLQLCVVTIMIFYIHKIIAFIPFLAYVPPYVPGLKGENKIGSSIILMSVFYKTQTSFINRIGELIERIK